jgi:chromosome segregation ATPase
MSTKHVAAGLGVSAVTAVSFLYGAQISDVYFAEQALSREQATYEKHEEARRSLRQSLETLENQSRETGENLDIAREKLTSAERETAKCREQIAKWQRREKEAKEIRQKYISECARLEKERVELQVKEKEQKEKVDFANAASSASRERVSKLRKNAERCMERLVGKKK